LLQRFCGPKMFPDPGQLYALRGLEESYIATSLQVLGHEPKILPTKARARFLRYMRNRHPDATRVAA
jgi:hypothetical protein